MHTPTGPNSFIFAYIFYQKVPVSEVDAPAPTRNPGSATGYYFPFLLQYFRKLKLARAKCKIDHIKRLLITSIHYHWRIHGGVLPMPPPPPTGSISFVFANVFTEKCTHQRSAPPQRVGAPPNGKSWIRH